MGAAREMVEALRKKPEGLTLAELTELTGLSVGSAKQVVWVLTDAGYMRSTFARRGPRKDVGRYILCVDPDQVNGS